jgi:hypothetical protein
MMTLNKRGTAALEFAFVAVPFFLLMFAIVDLGRYAITMQSLRMLAGAGARSVMIDCYTPKVISQQSPGICVDEPMTKPGARKDVAPFLFARDGTGPTLDARQIGIDEAHPTGTALEITASTVFVTMVPLWGTALSGPNNKLSASTTIPY